MARDEFTSGADRLKSTLQARMEDDGWEWKGNFDPESMDTLMDTLIEKYSAKGLDVTVLPATDNQARIVDDSVAVALYTKTAQGEPTSSGLRIYRAI